MTLLPTHEDEMIIDPFVPTPADPDQETDRRRGLLQVEVARAARLVAPLWPIERFIAVNPLQGLTPLGFPGAVHEARRWLGIEPLPGRSMLRRAIDSGRVDDMLLDEVLHQQVAGLADLPPLIQGATTASAADLVRADLVRADPVRASDPPRRPAPRTALERLDVASGTRTAAEVDVEVARWCALVVGGDHLPGGLTTTQGSAGPATTPSGRTGGALWETFRRSAPHDRRLRRLVGRRGRAALRCLASRPDDALAEALEAMGVVDADTAGELRGQVARLPGWSGYARWCDEWATPLDPSPHLSLMELLAVRVVLDAAVVTGRGATPPPAGDATVVPGESLVPDHHRVGAALEAVGLDPEDPALRRQGAQALALLDADTVGHVVLGALEASVQREVLVRLDTPRLASGSTGAGSSPPAVEAQVVCCIDARSEGLRRRIEALGPYVTLGFAGFFATPIRFRPLGALETVPAAPALLNPDVEVREEHSIEGTRRVSRARVGASTAAVVDDCAHSPLAAYALAETAGWLLGPVAAARTFAPGLIGRRRSPEVLSMVVDGGDRFGFALDQRVLVAETALRTMGLTSDFAPLVVLCGHGATTTANLHSASLECGACGGNRGGPNARAAAVILNDPSVREALAERGIVIPEATRFIGAEHDTTTDQVQVVDPGPLPETQQAVLARLQAAFVRAGQENATARMHGFADGSDRDPVAEVARRSADWAQTRPEWGLANNAAFLVAPRATSRDADLGGRVFLHDYDADGDGEGNALEIILTAPMVVAHWINAQYYGSMVAPTVWGAGDKVLHNALPGIGVLEGAGGDLRSGLPWQSVADAAGPRHEPVRLLTLVEAPRARLDEVVARNPILVELFDGGWVHLAQREPGARSWWLRRPGGQWHLVPAAPGGVQDSHPAAPTGVEVVA